MNSDSILALKVPQKVSKKLDKLAEATGRTPSFLALDALRNYLDVQAWQIQEIKKAVKEADVGDFATDEEVKKVLKKWKVNAR